MKRPGTHHAIETVWSTEFARLARGGLLAKLGRDEARQALHLAVSLTENAHELLLGRARDL